MPITIIFGADLLIGTCSGNNTIDYQPNNMEAP